MLLPDSFSGSLASGFLSQDFFDQRPWYSNVNDGQPPTILRPRSFEQAVLGDSEGHGDVGFDGDAEYVTGISIEAGRNIDAHADGFRGVHRFDRLTKEVHDLARQAGAEDGVDRHFTRVKRLSQLCGIRFRHNIPDVVTVALEERVIDARVASGANIRLRADEKCSNSHTLVEQRARDDESVAAVVARAADDADRTARAGEVALP